MTAAVVTLPLLLLYNVGLMMPGNTTMNAADLLTNWVVKYTGLTGFLVVNAVLVVASLILGAVLIRRGQFKPVHWLFLGLEGLVYGLLMGQAVVFLMEKAHLLGFGEYASYSLPQKLSMSAGAGYWEELVFRLLMIGGTLAAARRIFKPGPDGKGARGRVFAVGAVAVAASSILFSLAHYFGSESFQVYTFVYLTISGIVFAAVYLLRGFAVAAYMHFLYDVVVMVF